MRTQSRYYVAVFVCIAFTCRVGPVEAQGPSFSCAAAATASERMICAEPALAREDVLLARLYGAARRSAPLGNPGNGHVAAQRRWLAQRAQCDRGGTAAPIELGECLRLAYQSRLPELATAALYTDRELALAPTGKARLDEPTESGVVLRLEARSSDSCARRMSILPATCSLMRT